MGYAEEQYARMYGVSESEAAISLWSMPPTEYNAYVSNLSNNAQSVQVTQPIVASTAPIQGLGDVNSTIGSYGGSATPTGTVGATGLMDGSNRLGTPPPAAAESTGMFGLSESDVGLVGAGVNLVGTGLTYMNQRDANKETKKNNEFNRRLAAEDAAATRAYRASYA